MIFDLSQVQTSVNEHKNDSLDYTPHNISGEKKQNESLFKTFNTLSNR